MELLLMRHADAVDGYGDDFTRALSDKGRKQAEKMGDWLTSLKMRPDVVISSPLVRAMETAQLVMGRFGTNVALRTDERLACGMMPDDAAGLVHEVANPDERVMLVGHAPDLGILASYLIGASEVAVEMRKGSIACLQTVRIGRSGSVLRWLITPKM